MVRAAVNVRTLKRFAVLAVLVLASGAACVDEPRKTEDPDVGFLEFLGSVDGLAEVDPDYPSEGEAATSGKPDATVPPPALSPSQPPSVCASTGPTNE